jgi:hypothetical protein
MLINFIESKSNEAFAINPEHVVAVFTATEGDMVGKTFILFAGGNVAVNESYNDVVGALNGELK